MQPSRGHGAEPPAEFLRNGRSVAGSRHDSFGRCRRFGQYGLGWPVVNQTAGQLPSGPRNPLCRHQSRQD